MTMRERLPGIIRAKLGFTRLSNPDLRARLRAIWSCMTGNPNYPDPPLDLGKFGGAIEAFDHACATADDGSRIAIAERDAQRRDLIIMAQNLGHYVEHNCGGDMEKFLSSGFEPMSTTRTPAGPLDQPRIKKIRHGNTGELLVSATPVSGAYSYELRYTALDSNGVPVGESKTQAMGSARSAVSISGLTPGTVYRFEVHALGKLGYTNWSDPAHCMCT